MSETITIPKSRLAKFQKMALARGNHTGIEGGGSGMELASYLAGEKWSDSPECVDETIGIFIRMWNDGLGGEDRNRLLKPLIPRLIGTASAPEISLRRSWMAMDWLVREHLPAWLRLAGLEDELSALPEIANGKSLKKAKPRIHAAMAAAMAAAWDGGRDASLYAARSGALHAWGRMWCDFEARGAAIDAAIAAAGDASRAKRNLRPTVKVLQASAVKLLDRMISLTEAA